jgi:hypothetical protein
MNILLIGGNGFGRYVAREISKAGGKICGVVCRNMESAKILCSNFDEVPKPFVSIEQAIVSTKPGAVFICTPNELHYQHLLTVASLFPIHKPKLVFVEKPMIFIPYRDENVEFKLNRLDNMGLLDILVTDHANSYIISECTRRFHTDYVGVIPYRITISIYSLRYMVGQDLVNDLFPHLFAMAMVAASGFGITINFTRSITSVVNTGNQVRVICHIGGIEFVLAGVGNHSRGMVVELDNSTFVRNTEVVGDGYVVSITYSNGTVQDTIYVKDPLRVLISSLISETLPFTKRIQRDVVICTGQVIKRLEI